MSRFIYIVIHSIGIDGSYTVGAFSSYKNAQTLVEMYNKTSDSGEYDFYYVYKIKIDKYNIDDFRLVTKDNLTSLYYKDEEF